MQKDMTVGVIGAGTMGSGIAQIAAQAGHEVVLFDTRKAALESSQATLNKVMERLVEKGSVTPKKPRLFKVVLPTPRTSMLSRTAGL